MITLLIGGARSGKSALAERLVLDRPGPALYLATGTATDPDMRARIDRHRAARDPRFTTIETGPDLAAALRDAPDEPALVDALGTWLATHHDFAIDTDELVATLHARAARGAPTVLVTDEVGGGVHPSTPVGRAFRDALGLLNQRVAAAADDVWLVVAGRLLPLTRPEQTLGFGIGSAHPDGATT